MTEEQTNIDKIMNELRNLVLDRLDSFDNRLKNIEKSAKPIEPTFKCNGCGQEGIKLNFRYCYNCGGKFGWMSEQNNKKVK